MILAALLAAVIAVRPSMADAGTVHSGPYAGIRVTREDRTATRAYWEADLAYERARLAGAPESTAAIEALGTRLDGECRGVVTGVAKRISTRGGSQLSPRQDAERDRTEQQWRDLTAELRDSVELARSEPYLNAALAFAQKVQALRWSNAAITEYEHASAAKMEWELRSAQWPVCTDMEAWVRSGYATLSASTKAFAAESEAAHGPLRRLTDRLLEGTSLVGFLDPLSHYEGPQSMALVQQISALWKQHEDTLEAILDASLRIDYGLGVTSEAELRQLTQTSAKASLPPKGAVVIAKGMSSAGGAYTVWVQPRGAQSNGAGDGHILEAVREPRSCRLQLGFKEAEPLSVVGGAGVELVGNTGTVCLSRTHPLTPRLHCYEGRVVIETQTLPGARSVRLTLPDGRQINSRVGVVSRRRGGPAGFYYQAVAGTVSAPISLAELDGHGRRLSVVVLQHVPRCEVPSPFARHEPPTLASGTIAGGPGYSIVPGRGDTIIVVGSHRAPAFSLRLELTNETQAGGIERESNPTGPFAWQIDAGCHPHEFALVYGILHDPADTVWAGRPGEFQQLRRVQIPQRLHAHGVLAYAALPTAPSELVVRKPNGKAVARRKLKSIAREARETCEGEAEPEPA